MIAQDADLTQVRMEFVTQKAEIEKGKQSLERQIRDVNLDVRFDNRNATAFGNFHLVETFKRAIGFDEMLSSELRMAKGKNSRYDAWTLIDLLMDANMVGVSRFSHTEALRGDPGYRKVKGIVHYPDERTFRRVVSDLARGGVEQLRGLNLRVLKSRSLTERPREVILDIDDTVITLFGSQEGGKVEYNPRYRGRPSYRARVGFLGGSHELVALDLMGDERGDKEGFFLHCEQSLPPKHVLKGVRTDRGFFGDRMLSLYEDRCLDYACKAPLTERLKGSIGYISRENLWEYVDEQYDVAELTIPLHQWEKARRFVFIREKFDRKTGQLYLDTPHSYRHQAICTNLECSPEEVWRYYNQRSTVENRIDEIKDGFAMDETSQKTLLKNTALCLIKAIAYNLLNWMKSALMPGIIKGYRARTLRRRILNLPGNVAGSGRYRHVNLPENPWLERVMRAVKQKLDQFLYVVAQHLRPQLC